ncbi:MAG: hypothetical protein ACK6CT_13560 [Planctomycetia bacterium]|jgi:hypothetical protein
MRIVFRLLLAMALVPGVATPAHAEVKVLRLLADGSDFALDPDTGTLAVVVAETSSVQLIRAAAWQAGSTKPAATITVGAAPVTIAFKRFQDRRVFIVGCREDSHLYVFGADDGAVVKKIPVPSLGVWQVAASTNPDDPFVYYTITRPGHQKSTLNAISLGTLDDVGTVMDRCGEFTVSASGEVGYGGEDSGLSAGLQSSLRVSDGAADKPEFVPLFSESVAVGTYVPDPFDRYTATGMRIYTRSLERPLAKFDFVPRCWFRTRPLLVGVTPDEPNRVEADTLPEPPSRVTMRAASANSFRPVGDVIAFDLRQEARPGQPDAAGATRTAANKVARLRMFAYDPGECVLYARRSYLAVVPLADFHAGDEPFLTATLSGGGPLPVGGDAVLRLTPADPRVTARIELMPDGMRVSGTELRWRPAADQVGPNQLVVSLSHEGLEQTQTFSIPVHRASLKLPFAPVGCGLTASGRTAVIWDVADAVAWPPRVVAPAQEFIPRMASLDIATAAVRAEKRIPGDVRRAVILGERVFLLVPGADRCEVLDLPTLDRRTTLRTAGPIAGVGRCDGAIVFESPSALDVFDETTLEHRGRHAVESPQPGRPRADQAAVKPAAPTLLTSRGLVVQGVLLDAGGKPALLVRPAIATALPWGDRLHEPAFLRSTIQTMDWRLRAALSDRSGTLQLASAAIPPANFTASLTLLLRERPRPGSRWSPGWDSELRLTVDGDRPLTALLDKQVKAAVHPARREPLRAAVGGSSEVVLATFGSRMYSVPLPPAGGNTTHPPPSLTPRQSALALAAREPTVLRHSVEGGRQPLAFSLVTASPGLTIDAATGSVTIDRDKVVAEAAREIERQLAVRSGNASHVEAYRRLVAEVGERVAMVIGGKLPGLPVLVPIHVAVTDAEGRQDSLRYHVVAEIPETLLMPKLQKLDEDRPPPPAQAGVPNGLEQLGRQPAEAGELPRRVEALEQRLDLITRQLNQVLERMDKKK